MESILESAQLLSLKPSAPPTKEVVPSSHHLVELLSTHRRLEEECLRMEDLAQRNLNWSPLVSPLELGTLFFSAFVLLGSCQGRRRN